VGLFLHILHRDKGNRGRADAKIEADPEETLEGVVGNNRNGVHNGQHQEFTMP